MSSYPNTNKKNQNSPKKKHNRTFSKCAFCFLLQYLKGTIAFISNKCGYIDIGIRVRICWDWYYV